MLQQLLIHERHRPMLFTTVCMVRICPDRGQARVWSAGHPLPLRRDGDGGWEVPTVPRKLPSGLDLDCVWYPGPIELSSRWELLLYTDGLIEGRSGSEGRDLWVEGLLDLLRAPWTSPGHHPQQLVDELVETVCRLDPRHDDDVAVVMLTYTSPGPGRDDA